MKETTPDQVDAGVVFPGDYPRYDEDESETELLSSESMITESVQEPVSLLG